MLYMTKFVGSIIYVRSLLIGIRFLRAHAQHVFANKKTSVFIRI
jgi:hypothetical protein